MKKVTIAISISLIFCVSIVVAFLLCFPRKYEKLIDKYSTEFHLSKSLVASVIDIESGYKADALSRSGAVGLMQVLPSTASDCAKRLKIDYEESDLYNVDTNIMIGCFYLRYLIDMFDGNIENSLSAYNWGPKNVKDWIEDGNVDGLGTITNIPVEETRDYISKFRVSNFVYKNIYKYD